MLRTRITTCLLLTLAGQGLAKQLERAALHVDTDEFARVMHDGVRAVLVLSAAHEVFGTPQARPDAHPHLGLWDAHS